MRPSRILVATAATLVLGGSLAGCATARAVEAKVSLAAAAAKLGTAERASFTVSFSGDSTGFISELRVRALAKAGAAAAPPAEEERWSRMVANSTLTYGFDKRGKGDTDDRMAFTATVAGVAGVEVRAIDGVLYAKVPVAKLAAAFDAPAEATALPPELAAMVPGIEAAYQGKWVSLDADQLKTLSKSRPELGDLTGRKQADAVISGLRTLLEDVSVTRDAKDDSHLVATISSNDAVAAVRKAVEAVDPEAAKELDLPKTSKDIKIDLWVQDGALTAVEVDLGQFNPGLKSRAAVRMEIDPGKEIAVPQATELDLSQLLAMIGAAGAGKVN